MYIQYIPNSEVLNNKINKRIDILCGNGIVQN